MQQIPDNDEEFNNSLNLDKLDYIAYNLLLVPEAKAWVSELNEKVSSLTDEEIEVELQIIVDKIQEIKQMTMELPIFITHNQKGYQVVAYNRPFRLDYKRLGFKHNTWRTIPSYIVPQYKIENNILYLNTLEIRHEGPTMPILNGVSPDNFQSLNGCSSGCYNNLNMRYDYTGRLVIGSDYLFYNRGYPYNLWGYKNLIEFIIEHGHIVRTIDHSEKAEEIRKQVENGACFSPEDRTFTVNGETILINMNHELWWVWSTKG